LGNGQMIVVQITNVLGNEEKMNAEKPKA